MCRTRKLAAAVSNGMALLGKVVAILFTIVCCFATNGLCLPLLLRTINPLLVCDLPVIALFLPTMLADFASQHAHFERNIQLMVCICPCFQKLLIPC